jgi:hypothetical protein
MGMGWVGHVALLGTGEVHIGVWWGDLVEREHTENIDVEGMILLNWSSGRGLGGGGEAWSTDWIYLIQDGDRWWALVCA